MHVLWTLIPHPNKNVVTTELQLSKKSCIKIHKFFSFSFTVVFELELSSESQVNFKTILRTNFNALDV